MSRPGRAPDPFVLTTDLGAYVPRPESERVAEALQVALLVGRRVVALTGPEGIGKTMLLHVVARRLQRAFRAIYLPYAALPAKELCALILDVLSLPSGEDPEADLLAATARLEEASCTLVVMIDDASAMSLASARRMARIVGEANGTLRLIVVPEDDFQSGRTLAALGEDLDEVRFGVPMTLEETARYLRLRLEWARAPQETRARFNRGAVERLHALSGGLPGLLNELARAVARGGSGVLAPGTAASASPVPAVAAALEMLPAADLEEAAPPAAEDVGPEAVGIAPAVFVEPLELDQRALELDAPAEAAAPASPEPEPGAELEVARLGGEAADTGPVESGAKGEEPLFEAMEPAAPAPAPREGEDVAAAASALAAEVTRDSDPVSEADLYADAGPAADADDDLPVPAKPRTPSSAPLSRHVFAVGGSPPPAAVIHPPASRSATSVSPPQEARSVADRPLPPVWRSAPARPRPAPRRPRDPEADLEYEERAEEALARLLGVDEEDDAPVAARWRDDVEDFDPGAERLLPGQRGARTDAPPSWKGFASAALIVGLLIAGVPWVRSWLQPAPASQPAAEEAAADTLAGAAESGAEEASGPGYEDAAAPLPDPDALAPVSIEVQAEPPATVEVDGVYLGKTPLRDVPLLPGQHVFRTRFADGRVDERRVVIAPGSRRINLVPERAVVDRAGR